MFGVPFLQVEGVMVPLFLWSLLPVGGIGPVACQVFLVGGVDLDLFSLECNEAYNNEF